MDKAILRLPILAFGLFGIQLISPVDGVGKVQGVVREAFTKIQRNNVTIQTLRTDIVFIDSFLFPDGRLLPQVRFTGKLLYKRPDNLRLDFIKVERFLPPDFEDVQDITDEYEPHRIFYDKKGFVIFNRAGEIILPREDLPFEVQQFLNMRGNILAVLPFHVVSLIDQFKQDQTDFVVVKLTPSPNAGSKALTRKEMTMTIDITRGVITKIEEIIKWKNLKEDVFDDLPKFSIFGYESIGGAFVLKREESAWDMRYRIAPEGESFETTEVLYKNHYVEEHENIEVNVPIPASDFMFAGRTTGLVPITEKAGQ